jgi:hypothetical protein
LRNDARGLTAVSTANAQVLIVDPVTDSNVYLATSSFGSGLYKSTNAAMTWAAANKGLKNIFKTTIGAQ